MKIMAAINVQDWIVVPHPGQLYPKRRLFAQVLEVRKGEVSYQARQFQTVGTLSTKGLHLVYDRAGTRLWAHSKEIITWNVNIPGYGVRRRAAPSAASARQRELTAIGAQLAPNGTPAVKTKMAEEAISRAAHRTWSAELIEVTPVFDTVPYSL